MYDRNVHVTYDVLCNMQHIDRLFLATAVVARSS